MPDRDARVRLGYDLDQGSANQIKQFVDDVEQRFESLDRLLQAVGRDGSKSGQELVDGLRQSRAAADEAKSSVDDLGDSLQKASKVDIGLSGLRRTGGALTQLGLREIGRPVSLLGDVGQVGKELGEVGTALEAVGLSATGLVAIALPLAAAFALVTEIMRESAAASEKQRAGLQALMDTQDEYYKDLTKFTTAQAKARVDELQAQQASLERQKKENIDVFMGLQGGDPNLKGLTGEAAIEKYKTLGKISEDPAVANAVKKFDDLNKQILDAGTLAARLTGDLQSNAFAANDASARIEELNKKYAAQDAEDALKFEKALTDQRQKETKAIDDNIKKIDERYKFDQQVEDLIKTGRQKDLDAAVSTRDEEIRRNQREINELEQLKDTTGKYSDKIKELKDRNDELIRQQDQLIGQATKYVDLNEQDDANARKTATQQKYNDQVEQTEQQSLQRRADIQQRYNDALVTAAERAVEAAKAALQNLTQQQEDLAAGLQRDLTKEQVDDANKALTIQVNEHRQEVQELQTHLRALQNIRDQARFREFDALLNRNFLSVLQSRLQESADLNKENTSFGDRTSQLRTDEEHQLTDLQHSIQDQRQARLVAYQNALQDADKQYRRALIQADQQRDLDLRHAAEARTHDLQGLNEKLATEQRLKHDAYVKELQLDATYGEKRVELQGKIEQALVDQANNALSQLTANPDATGIAHRRALGGPASPGQAYIVNDAGRRESVDGMQFMGGQGVYLPFKSGTVDPGLGGNSRPVSIQISQQITSAAPDAAGLARDLKPYMHEAAVEVSERIMR